MLPFDSHTHSCADDFPAATTDGPYSMEWIASDAAIQGLETAWNRLSAAASHPNIFTTFDWFRVWSKRLTDEDQRGCVQPRVILLKRGELVEGLVPLVQHTVSRWGRKVRRLEFVTEHSDYNDLVLGNDATGQTEAVVNFLARTSGSWEILDLRNLRIDETAIMRIEAALIHAGLPYRLLPEQERSPFMPIAAPWSEAARNRRLQFARYAFRKFSESAAEEFRVRMVENPRLEPGLLDKLIAVEAQKHVRGEKSLPFLGRYRKEFHLLLDALGPLGWITIGLVEWRGRVAAYMLLCRCGRKLWDYQSAFDRDCSKLSLGTVLTCAAIDYGFANGFDEFDFLRGEEDYKLRWTKSIHQSYRLLIWNRRWISRMFALAYLRMRVPSSETKPGEVCLEGSNDYAFCPVFITY